MDTAIDTRPWVGFDLDGTLAEQTSWKGATHIGPPIKSMVDRVKRFLSMGIRVKIFTARVGPHGAFDSNGNPVDDTFIPTTRAAIEAWCLENIGQVLEVTCVKDMYCVSFYDDRCIQVESNTGVILGRE